MSEIETTLDAAHEAMQSDLNDDAARLAFYEKLADAELFLLLKEEPKGDTVDPEVVEIDNENGEKPDVYLMVFDREDRLAAFAEGPAPYAALPGRVVAAMIAGSEMGLALNLGAVSSILIPSLAMTWLAETLGPEPEEVESAVSSLERPTDLTEQLLAALATKLDSAAGLAHHALLARARYEDESTGLVLGFVDVVPGAEQALARAAQEAMTFSGEALRLDVGFFQPGDPVAKRLAAVALRLDLPQVQQPEARVIEAPGMDPNKPPIIKF